MAIVTLQAADDSVVYVRQQAYEDARFLYPDDALTLLAGALSVEPDSMALLAALDTLAVIGPSVDPLEVRRLLDMMGPGADVALRHRAERVREELGL